MVQPMGSPHEQPARRKTSALAITAFVISLLFFLPFVPVIGSILGIIAVARNRPDLGGKGLAIAAIPVGIVTALLLQGMMAAVAIPSFIKYIRKSKTVEATQGLHRLVAGAREHARAERHDESGRLLPGQFPLGQTDWVPATPCCQQPSAPRCSPSPAGWTAEPWRSLGFQVAEPHHFQWRYSSDGRTMTAEARGDLDCDGTYSSFKAEGTIAEGGMSFRGPTVENELE